MHLSMGMIKGCIIAGHVDAFTHQEAARHLGKRVIDVGSRTTLQQCAANEAGRSISNT